MKWMRERDALIAQTLAFVQSVTGRSETADRPAMIVPEPASAPTAAADLTPLALAVVVETPKAAAPAPMARPLVPGDFRSELQNRVASFRAHQERFHREREEYFSTTLARLRAAIKDAPAAGPRRPADHG